MQKIEPTKYFIYIVEKFPNNKEPLITIHKEISIETYTKIINLLSKE
jgi:hypothetical protein